MTVPKHLRSVHSICFARIECDYARLTWIRVDKEMRSRICFYSTGIQRWAVAVLEEERYSVLTSELQVTTSFSCVFA